MKIVKASQGSAATAVTAEDLALINRLARREMGEEDVYLFSVRLCDNEVDREGERFAPETLEKLAELLSEGEPPSTQLRICMPRQMPRMGRRRCMA